MVSRHSSISPGQRRRGEGVFELQKKSAEKDLTPLSEEGAAAKESSGTGEDQTQDRNWGKYKNYRRGSSKRKKNSQ